MKLGTNLSSLSPATDATYTALAHLYGFFNQSLFGGALPVCLLTFQRQAKTMGYASQGRWVNGKSESIDELSINPEYLFGSTLEELCQTMIHEQCHIWQYHFGTPSRRFYHDREWANKMESLGLIPSSTGLPGGARTGQKINDYLLADGPAHLAIESLKASGFDMPWIDKYPVRNQIYPPKIYDQNGLKVAASKLTILGIKTLPTTSPVCGIQPEGQVIEEGVEVSQWPGSTKAQIVSVANMAFAEAAEIEAINQGIKASAAEGLAIFPVKLAAKAPPTRAKYVCSCAKPNHIWGRPGLKITCEECNSSFTITV
jgi:hypothetical protein